MYLDWQKVRHLGVLNAAEVQSLQPVLPVLQQALPTVQITLLTTVSPAVSGAPMSTIPVVLLQNQDAIALIDTIRSFAFDAAIMFTAPHRSPYALAYLCYLAGVPIRVGQSKEFGGSVLSSCITPPLEEGSLTDYHLHLLTVLGLAANVTTAGDRNTRATDGLSPARSANQAQERLLIN